MRLLSHMSLEPASRISLTLDKCFIVNSQHRVPSCRPPSASPSIPLPFKVPVHPFQCAVPYFPTPRNYQSAAQRRLIHWHRFHIMQRESPSKRRGPIQSCEPGLLALRVSLPGSRQSPARPLDSTVRMGSNSPEGLLSSPRQKAYDDLSQLRREIALRRQEQELRSIELKRILPTDISESLTAEPLAEDRNLPQCALCLLL